MNIRESIRDGLEKSGMSMSKLARKTGVDKGNLSNFLAGRCGLGVGKLERVFKALDIRVAPPKYPKHLAWLAEVDRWQAILAPRLPDIPPEDLRQILVNSERPIEERMHFVSKVGGIHVP